MRSNLSHAANEELQSLLIRLKPWSFASRVWDQILTANDQDKVGGLQSFYDQTIETRFGISTIYANLKSITPELAAVKLSFALGMIGLDEHNWLHSELGIATRVLSVIDKPQWDIQSCELKYLGEVVRKYSRTAKNVFLVLNVFEEELWPNRVDDPMPHGPDSLRLHATIHSINKKLRKIHFNADGAGEGICWSVL